MFIYQGRSPFPIVSDTTAKVNDCQERKFIGNVNKDNILDIWKNEQFKNVRQRLLKKDRNAKPCEKCNVNGLHVGNEFSILWQEYYK